MDRKTAIAAAVAITMSLSSGVIALSANAGALGFGVSTPVAATQTVIPSAARSVQPVPAKAAFREGGQDDGARSTQLGAARATNSRGEQDD
jgi:hypothetical protein